LVALDDSGQRRHSLFEPVPAHIGFAAVEGDHSIADLSDKSATKLFHQHLWRKPKVGINLRDRSRDVGKR